jgi:hypothetical protein
MTHKDTKELIAEFQSKNWDVVECEKRWFFVKKDFMVVSSRQLDYHSSDDEPKSVYAIPKGTPYFDKKQKIYNPSVTYELYDRRSC